MKIAMHTAATGAIVAGGGVSTVTVTDFFEPKGITVEGLGPDDALQVVHRNGAGDAWLPLTDGGKNVQLNSGNKTVVLSLPDTYDVQSVSDITGTVNVYAVEAG
jgi:hypothetical protein